MNLIHNDKSSTVPLKLCDNFFSRFKGLMFVTKPIKSGIVIAPCDSIHMFFMFQSIDVVMVDSKDNVMFVKENVKPWTIILPKNDVLKTFELPLYTIQHLSIELGDKLTY